MAYLVPSLGGRPLARRRAVGAVTQHDPTAVHCYCPECVERSELAAIATDTTLEQLSLAVQRYTDAGGDLTLVCNGCKAAAVMLDGIGPGD
jgi:hypothetical protein